jgi:hypothetical protein
VFGSVLIAKTNAWNRERLVEIRTEHAGIFNQDTGLTFQGWVAPDEEADALARGAAQIGGIPTVNSDNIHNKTPPPDVATNT